MLGASTALAGGKQPTILRYTGELSSQCNWVSVAAGLDPAVIGATITFTLNNTETCSGEVDANGIVSCGIYPQEPAGTYDLVASYAGDSQYQPSSTKVSFEVHKCPTKLTYTGATSAQHGATVTAAARLHPAAAGATIVFTLNSNETCSGTVDGNGIASCPITPMEPAGVYPITAVFAGNSKYLPSQDTVPFTVTKVPTTVTYTGPSTAPVGQPVVLSGTLDPAIAGAVVVFGLETGESCFDVVDANGNASCTVFPQTPGPNEVTVVYGGNDIYAPSSDSAPITVGKNATTTTYTGATSSYPNETVIASATLSPAVAGATIVFTLSTGETCSDVVDSAGAAGCPITPQTPGTHTITASYAGNNHYLPSSDSAPFVVGQGTTSLVYTGDLHIANAEPAQMAGKLTAGGTPVAGRTINFVLGSGSSAQSCSAVTNASGVAACTIASAAQPLNAAANVAIASTFGGDSVFQPASDHDLALLQYMTGDAYGLMARVYVLLGSINIGRTPYTGEVRTANASTTPTPCVANISAKLLGVEIVGANAICANVTTGLAPGSSVATSTVANARVALGILPLIQLTAIQARATATCSSQSGSATVAALSIGGLNVAIGTGPNFTIALPLGARIVINEQIPHPNADHGMIVNAVHVYVPPVLGLLSTDIVIGSATAGIHNCKPKQGFLLGSSDDLGLDGDEAADADAALEPAGGCQSSRSGGALWLAALAATTIVVRRRRRARIAA